MTRELPSHTGHLEIQFNPDTLEYTRLTHPIYYRIAGIIALFGLTVTTLILFGSMAMFEFTFEEGLDIFTRQVPMNGRNTQPICTPTNANMISRARSSSRCRRRS